MEQKLRKSFSNLVFLFIFIGIPEFKARAARCRAPPAVLYATSSVPSRPNITFRHGTVVTYTCDENKMATGNNRIRCINGRWSNLNFRCKDNVTCSIPDGAQFNRSLYRPLTASSTTNYAAGSVVEGSTRIVVICKKDINGDMISKWAKSECSNGSWEPALPSCRVMKRCRAPPRILHAKASERINPHISFPHGYIVTYTCDEGKMTTGNNSVYCVDGNWTSSDFRCEEPPEREYLQATTTTDYAINSQSGACSRLTVSHGTVNVKDVARGIYGVLCNRGYRLVYRQDYRCRDGQWIGREPVCNKRSYAKCKIPRSSIMRKFRDGEAIADRFVDHLTVCKHTCRIRPRDFKVTKCVSGRWRPRLRKCYRRDSRKGNRNRTRSASGKNCTIPEMEGGLAWHVDINPTNITGHDVISENETKYNVGDQISHGHMIRKSCEDGKILLLDERWNISMFIVCNNGKWDPEIQPCLAVEETTSTDSSTTDVTYESTSDTSSSTSVVTSSVKIASASTVSSGGTTASSKTVTISGLTSSTQTLSPASQTSGVTSSSPRAEIEEKCNNWLTCVLGKALGFGG